MALLKAHNYTTTQTEPTHPTTQVVAFWMDLCGTDPVVHIQLLVDCTHSVLWM